MLFFLHMQDLFFAKNVLVLPRGVHMIFEYGKKELTYLKKRDKELGKFIKTRGMIEREVESNTFLALIQNIIAQQINGKTSQKIFERVCTLCDNELTEQTILALDKAQLQACGMSERKAANIHAAAKFFLEKNITPFYLAEKSDKEIIEELTQLPGVGVWTAEMLLLFSLQRKNILSCGDFGIKKGLCLLHGLEKIDKQTFMAFKEQYSPYGSVASLYLWEIANTNLMAGKK